jgi:hypothetical protein
MLPGTAAENSVLRDVACPAPGDCVAVGGYGVLEPGQEQGLTETLSNGAWTPAAAPLPAGASNNDMMLQSVACPAAGQCVAAGAYDLAEAGAVAGTRPLIETLSNGSWSATGPSLPPGALSFAHLAGVACPATGACVATGMYKTPRRERSQARCRGPKRCHRERGPRMPPCRYQAPAGSASSLAPYSPAARPWWSTTIPLDGRDRDRAASALTEGDSMSASARSRTARLAEVT